MRRRARGRSRSVALGRAYRGAGAPVRRGNARPPLQLVTLMSDGEFQILREEIRALRELVETVFCSSGEVQASAPAVGHPDELVDTKYVARLFGCSVRSVREGKAGTDAIPWVSRRPLKCRRGDAHAVSNRRAEQSHAGRRRVAKLLDRTGKRAARRAA